jgi:two-component system LytT family response regulator
MLRVLIADDEAPARRKLARFLGEHGDCELVAQASNGIDAVDLVAMTRPDLVFLDIHMPDLDGLGVAEALASGQRPPRIVFVTAHDAYAVKAFEVSAIDYLLKPYDRERFAVALARARTAARSSGGELADTIARARRAGTYARRILAASDGRSTFVAAADVVRIEADGNSAILHAKRGRFSLRATMDALEARLDPEQFARVGRSHLINIDEIAAIDPWFHGDYKVTLRDGTELTWGRRYAAKRPDLLKPAAR